MDRSISFEVTHTSKDCKARCGLIHTPHGTVETPMFMPVGTQATVKFLSTEDLHDIGSGKHDCTDQG